MASRKLIVELVGDERDLIRSFQKSAQASKRFGRDIDRVGRSTDKLRIGFGTLAKSAVAFAGVTAGLHALGRAIPGVIDAASGMNEQMNRVNVVFRASAGEIEDWSKTTADAFGVSREAALEAAGSFGGMLQAAGITEQASADMSRSLVELAADMGSFNNIDPTEMLDKLRSGLAGEAEPLRRFSVFLSEAAVANEAVRIGLVKSGQKLTEQQKIQARYSLILKQTSKQQGDFARTSDSFANAQRRVAAQFRDLAAQIGGVVLPIISKVTSGFADMFNRIGAAQGIGGKFNAAVDIAKEVGQRLLTAIRNVPWREILSVVAERVYAAVSAINWGAVGETVGRLLATGFDKTRQFIQSVDWARVGRVIVQGIRSFLEGVNWTQVFKSMVKLSLAALKGAQDLFKAAGREIADALKDGLVNQLERLDDWLKKQMLKIVLAILEPLDFKLGPFGVPGVHSLVESVKAELAELERAAKQTGAAVQKALTPSTAAPAAPAAPAARAGAGGGGDTTAKNIKQIAKDITATPWLTYRLALAEGTKTLKDDLAVVTRIFNVLVERFGKSKNLKERTALLQAIESYRDQAEGLARDIRDANKAIRDAEQERKKAEAERRRQATARQRTREETAQFGLLGLGPGGAERVPGVKALQAQTAKLREAIEGTFLDTRKQRGLLAHIQDVLSGRLGKVRADVRRTIQQILADIRQQLASADKQMQARAKERGITPGYFVGNKYVPATGWGMGFNPRAGTTAAGTVSMQTRPQAFQINNLNLYGVQDVGQLEEQLYKRANQRPQTRRGT